MNANPSQPDQYLSAVTSRPSGNHVDLREVVRVVFPADRDMDALPLYVDGPINPENGAGPMVDTNPLRPDDVLSRRSLRVRSGARVSLGSYFNAFPAGYWRWWTTVENVVLRVLTKGSGSVIVYRSNARGVAQRVDGRRVQGTELSEFDLTLAPFGDGGWYWFDLVADEDGMELTEAGWHVPTSGRSIGRLTLGVTTFNRPDYCLNTIETIGQATELEPLLDELIIVDQGDKLVEDEAGFAQAKERLGGKLRVIRQANLGGSGGFSRNMYEVVRGRPDGTVSDYVLILDDDINLEVEGILRAAAFADMCRLPSIVGGHMFDLYNKTVLNAFVENINQYRFMWGPPEGLGQIDFAQRGLRSRHLLHRRWDADYNGWWMCLIPRSVLERVGLSLPVFIKWDDAEYSLRASEAGFPTITLPGAAVWHVSWTEKDDAVDWQAYFHARNRLIAALSHSKFALGGRMLRESLTIYTKHIISMQYYAAAAVLLAVEDVLKGPDQLHELLPTRTAELRALTAQYTDARVTKDLRSLPPARREKPSKRQGPPMPPPTALLLPWTAYTAVKQVAIPPRELSREYPEAVVANQDGKWYNLARFDSAVVSNADGTGVSFYRRDPKHVRRGLAAAAPLYGELAKRWTGLAGAYREALPRITSVTEWERTFHANTVE